MPTHSDSVRDTPTKGVRIIRAPEDGGSLQTFFQEPIPGNHVVSFGTLDLDSLGGTRQTALTLAYAVIEPGAIFPMQYHSGGTELAFIVQGEGAIEVEEEGIGKEPSLFAGGDLVLIGPDVLYQVRNRSGTLPLCAWVSFPPATKSFWPDGRDA